MTRAFSDHDVVATRHDPLRVGSVKMYRDEPVPAYQIEFWARPGEDEDVEWVQPDEIQLVVTDNDLREAEAELEAGGGSLYEVVDGELVKVEK